MLNFSTPACRRFRHDGDGTEPEPGPGRYRGAGGLRPIGVVLALVLARCGVPPPVQDGEPGTGTGGHVDA